MQGMFDFEPPASQCVCPIIFQLNVPNMGTAPESCPEMIVLFTDLNVTSSVPDLQYRVADLPAGPSRFSQVEKIFEEVMAKRA